jgi:hypothetical protein
MEPVEIELLEVGLAGQQWEGADGLQEPLPPLQVEKHMQQLHW